MFQFSRFASRLAPGFQVFNLEGCPIRIPADITDICSSPQLFAACHVLLRLSVPRHSSCALCNLTCCALYFVDILTRMKPSLRLALRPVSALSCQYFSMQDLISLLLFVFYLLSLLSLCSFQGAWSRPRGHTRPQLRLKVDVVGSSGLEPPTLRLSGARSNHLSYEPMGFQGPGPEN